MLLHGVFSKYTITNSDSDLNNQYSEAVGVVEGVLDCGYDLQGHVALYSDSSRVEKLGTVPVLVLKPTQEAEYERAVLLAAKRLVCFDMVLLESGT
ncbi:hypothetical protein [Pectobacterium phage PPWS1]|uniref:Uncharacterized protein n=1 Tax=Pectobacterium phage PPWS1 TaxID=1685500 RepID=A0A0P0UW82_9CAUD|nr:hypothetical protein HOR09_gp55 [Pectobacterium phage PPWS1]BAS69570.1 hypothetical protein [Pectobacterium phage PPWS1]